MSFLNPLFLLGMAALAAPLLVHLVRRTRARRVEFPTLWFVRQIPQRTVRRKRLHNLLLLALRCLALLLVVIAFTRPYFSGDAATIGANQSKRAAILLVDTSFSMRYGGRLARAKQRAAAIAEATSPNEQLALVSFDLGYNILGRFTPKAVQLRPVIEGIEAGLAGTDYEQVLRGAESLLREAGFGGLKRIYLISDFQASGWAAERASFHLGGDIQLVPVDIGEEAAPNIAVTEVSARGVTYGQRYTDKLAARIANFSDDARQRLAVDFQINEQSVEKREISIGAHDSAVIEFTGFNLAEGVNRCVIAVRADDDFALDNQFYFTLRREAQAKALIIETAVRGRNESLYLRHALTTGEGLPFALTVRSAGTIDPAELPDYSVIILNDAGRMSPALADGLAKFVEAGGGLIAAAGPHSEPEEFNRALERIAPATLGEAVQRPRGEAIAMSDVKIDHPVFEIFRDSGRLATAPFFGYRRSEVRGNATVLARFEDGSPALVEAGAGAKGKILLFTSTFDIGWTDLPLTPLYLPLVQQMARYLVVQDESAWQPLGQPFTVRRRAAGELPAVDLPSGARLAERAETPDGDLIVVGREPGFYRLRYPEQAEYVAVNLSGEESDLTRLNVDEFVAALIDPAAAKDESRVGARAAEQSREEAEAEQRIWWPLLLLALLLFIAEALLARRTKMAKVIG